MDVLNQSAFLKALGWSILDSFWQMGILWLLYVMLTGNGKRFNSPQRHSLALLSLGAGSLWFLITLIFHFNQVINSNAVVIYTNSTSSDTINTNVSVTSAIGILEPVLPFLSIAYLSAIIYLFIRLYRQYYVTQKLFFTGTCKVSPELRVFLQTVAAQMGIKKVVRIWLSELVDTPLTIGFWKPVILLPVAAINHLSPSQAEAIILHELNHIRRNDYLINLLIACMDIILFFNPFVRILTHIIKNERENSCDDMVLQFRYDAGQYAKALLLLEKNRVSTPALTIAATGRSKKLLLNRVERILNKKTHTTPISQKLVACFLSALLIGFIGWYNPGKIIVKTIDKIEEFSAGPNENPNGFTTATITDEEPEQAPLKAKKKKTVQRFTSRAAANTGQQPTREQVEAWTSESTAGETMPPTEITTMESSPIASSSISSFIATQPEVREYSIAENVITTSPDYSAEIHPYVPRTSFSYNILEDTARPKKYVVTKAELKAREAMSAAMKALQEIDWQKLEKEMNAAGKKIDILKLQQQLQKAMGDVDWKKINEEVQSSLIRAENEILQEHTAIRAELQKYQQDRSTKSLQQQKIKTTIIEERLCEQESGAIKPVKKKPAQKKKIVYI